MADVITKLADVKNLQDLSKVLVLPILSVAYISSSSFQLNIGDDTIITMKTLDFFIPIFAAFVIFLGKTLFFSAIAIITEFVLTFLEFYTKGIITLIIILTLLSLGFAGIFANEQIPGLNEINKTWFYASLVVSFYLHSKLDSYTEKNV